MFEKILIANRGEIAVRIIRTARRLGIATVAVYSDADRDALHVRMADQAVCIGPAPASESYLDGDRIIAAALETAAQAIHPGYGFLSENPDFVEKVEDAGLIFVGPSSQAIRAMGLKDAAKRLMEKAGVPVVPGYHGDTQALVALASKANEIGYPVLIKARAGGGGKGMRLVSDPDAFPDALAAAQREAKAAFGDERVLVEKYIQTPRHIEVQVFGDSHGNAVHLFERDCSAQRRHQKVIEEAPAPGMNEETRAAMTEAAVKAARAISYSGAGTIEFIVDASEGLRPDRFWFMEMNTRLQVEHPVTEMITGVDLVEWQLRVAAGEPLPRTQDEITVSGHAVEARLYAEDATRDFLPATGTLHHLRFPDNIEAARLRIDAGVAEKDAITPFYDPMIAKLIVHAPTREEAIEGLAGALEKTEIAGSTVNLGFLTRLLRDDDFSAGRMETGLIGRKQDVLTKTAPLKARHLAAAIAATSGAASSEDTSDPFSTISGYGHFGPLLHKRTLVNGEEAVEARVAAQADGALAIHLGDDEASRPIIVRRDDPTRFASWPGHITVFEGADALTLKVPDRLQAAEESGGGDRLRAPMPGLVKLVRASVNETVQKGQPLLVLEAMKMEHTITAPHDGVVAEIATEGLQVNDGAMLVRFQEAE
ncbi:acetyl/propionyl/methylcrotonyl-CoA carboxylase subunit alpha [Nitratireductor rhodophyticola]|uniref:acetyl/propionyl/methylcrotonyl-CoA carboxylase subunit alpha n=1 Tax=Nitratireductor rhodophyticola TaxID=2854036 RepID=UPI002AC8B50E|nr:acetyl/propionyl/methylcrotonyl-CoA carboxylase subunit alpha [Nitratireductor rhodophyticola]WPZ14097.1 acetyl/propionyl/methylcrotonyl-CoA carboxylase subunit alpha [Nitratireductor rhodophyticola]